MEPAVIATTAILLTLVVGLVVQTAVSYVKKAKKSKKPAKDRRKRPESNKENVVPSSASFGAPSSAASFEVSSGGQTKITEQSHYQQIKSSVIRSESPVAPPTVLKHETTTTETKTSGEKLLPLCVEAFQDSVLSPISGVSKTKQQEVTEHTTYQQFKSSTVSSDQSQRQFSPLRSETAESQTKSAAEKLLPVCVEAFQDSVLSPISGIKKTKKQEVTEQSNYQQFQSKMVNSDQSEKQFSSVRSESPGTQSKSAAEKLLPVCVEAFQDSVLSPISGIKKTKKQEVIENSHYEDNSSNVNRSVTPPISPDSPRIWMSVKETRSSAAEKLLPMCVEAFQDSVLSPISGISKTKHQEVIEHSHQQQKESSARSVSPAVYRSSPKPWSPTTQSPVIRKVLPLCVEAFQDSIQSPVSGISKTKRKEVLEQSNYQSSTTSVSSLVRCLSPKPWTAPDTETKTSATETSQTLDTVTETSYRQQSQSSMSHSVASSAKPSMPHTQAKSSAHKLLPVCVEAFQDSVLSPISGIKKTKTHEIQSNVVRSVTPPVSTASPKPWKSESNAKTSAAEKLLPVCVEAFQDSVLSPISGISKTKKQEIQSGVTRSPTPPVPNTVPKPWKSELQTGSSAAAKLLPKCVEAFQDSVLSPISGIPKTKQQEMSSSPIRSVTPPVLSTAPKPWKPETQATTSSAEKLLPVCVEAFQDSVLSPISGIAKTKKQEPTMPVASKAQESHSAGEKLLPLCVEAFQDSVLSPISGIGKTKKNEVVEPTAAEPPAQPSAGEKLLPLCVEAFQDSVLSPISGIKKTKNQEEEVAAPSTTEEQAKPSVGEKLLPLCVEAFQDSVLSPISGIAKTMNKEVVETESQAQPSVGEKLLPLCVEAFQDSVLSPISGIKKTKNQEEDVSQKQPSAGEKLLPLCVEAFQDSVLSPISGVSKTKTNEVTEHEVPETHSKPSPGEALLPLCVEAFQDSVLSPISGIRKTKTEQEMASMPNDTEAKSSAERLLPLCVEAFQDSVLSPISGISKTKHTELAGAANKPVAPVSESVSSRNVFQQSEMQSSTLPRRKKQFSSSSFYEDEYSSFPTIEEQVQLCRQIADSLVDESGKKSKGASMFDRRMKRSTSWVHENPEDEDGTSTPDQSEEKEMSDVDTPPRPKSKTPPSLKLILDPRLPQDIAMLKTSGQQISEHNVVSPDICHHLVKDLQSPVGKGGALFAKRKKKAEDWVVDEDKVKEHTKTPEPIPEPPVPPLHKLKEKFQNPKLKLVKSPWEAALQSPIGSVDGAFVDVKPEKLAETVIKAADYKIRSNSQSPISESGSIPHSYPFTPPVSAVYKLTAPRGWTGRGTTDEYDSGTSSGAFTSPEPPLMPSRPFPAAPTSKPTFQNFNTTPKTWNEAKRADASQPSGFKPVRPPTYYTK